MSVPDASRIKAEMNGARENLRSAEILLAQDMPRTAISSAYYAIFHAARAALWTRGNNAKTHSGIVRLFSQQFTASGEIEQRYLKMLVSLQQKHQQADYELGGLEVIPDRAEILVAKARQFVHRIETFIRT